MAKEKNGIVENLPFTADEFVQAEKDIYKKELKFITRELGKVESSFLNIGFSLNRIYSNRLYAIDGYSNIYELAKDKFGLARGTVNNFINVVETFGKRDNGQLISALDDKYKDFSVSQLVVLLGYINRGGTELDCFTSDMSVRHMKKKVKELESKDIVEIEDGVQVELPAEPEVTNTLISCYGVDDYNKKVDDIDMLIMNMFAKSKKRVRIEIVAVEY